MPKASCSQKPQAFSLSIYALIPLFKESQIRSNLYEATY